MGAVAAVLRQQNINVGVFKPVAVGCKDHWDGLVAKDAEFLAACANTDMPLKMVNPVSFVTDVTPVVAAERERKAIDFDAITKAYRQWCNACDCILVEGIGGVRTPLTVDEDLLDLAGQFGLPVVVIVRSCDDMLNQALMTIDCIRAANLSIAGVVINGFSAEIESPYTNTGPSLIALLANVPILADVPWDETVDMQNLDVGDLAPKMISQADWQKLISR